MEGADNGPPIQDRPHAQVYLSRDNEPKPVSRRDFSESTESLATIDAPPAEDVPPSKIYHPFSPHVLALLIPTSIFGVLARLGLEALVTYNGQSVFSLAYIQATGCFVMGVGLGLKAPFGRFYGPLYTALTTGFCGSLTTFSGWQVDIFDSWVNAGEYHKGGFLNFIDGLTKTWVTLAVSLASLSFGLHVSGSIVPYFPALRPPSRNFRYILSMTSVLAYAATIPAYFLLPANVRHQATAALLFSYPGTLTRYILSIYLNPRWKHFPLGTFTANTIGTALLGLFHVLQGLSSPVSPNACSLLQGLGDGYCGCLSTVSTFAVEVATLGRWKSWHYVLASWVAGQLLLLVIMGPSFWAGGVSKQAACTFQI
ncbi:CrcB-like protein-domain-containing protein [Scleroderma citrinum]